MELGQEQQDERISLLEELTKSIESTLNRLKSLVDDLFTALTTFPKSQREKMVCAIMDENNLTTLDGLGLTCSLDSKGDCSCENIRPFNTLEPTSDQ